MTLTIGSLFSGIGGLELGLERAGLGPVLWQVECDDYATRVLERHWPDATRHRDVREVGRHNLAPVDVICGGFPCQDISNAGKRAGLAGERSGLWSEFARIVRELRPRYVLVENVAALLGRGLGDVLGDLAACGYDAEWDCIPAAAVGAPHRRDRLFVVAYRPDALADSYRGRLEERGEPHIRAAAGLEAPRRIHAGRCGTPLADSQGERRGEGRAESARQQGRSDAARGGGEVADSMRDGLEGLLPTGPAARAALRSGSAGWWETEPDVGRVVDGVPARVDRLRCLGNAVVPQVAEFIGRRIAAHAGVAT
jgi:DNA (cytosine-5)-methyltransferase 1